MAKLTINIGANISKMKKGLANAQSSVRKWSRKISGLTKLALGTAFVGFGAGIVSVIKKSAQLAAQFEQIKVAFTTMTGSADKARGLIAELNEFSKATPFRPEQVMSAAKVLLAFGFSAKEVSGVLRMLGDVSAGTGKDLSEMAVIFGQIKGAGRLMGQDLNQLINAGFNPLQVMSEQTGKSMADLKDEMSKGAISFEMVTEAFKTATSEGGLFFNMMEEQSQTLNGQLSTLEGGILDLARSFGETFLPEIKSAVGMLLKLVSAFEDVAAARKKLDSGGVSAGQDIFETFAKSALNNSPLGRLMGAMGVDMAGLIEKDADTISAPASTSAVRKRREKEIAESREADKREAEKAAAKKKLAFGLADDDFASADPMADLFAEYQKQWDKAWDDRDVRVAQAKQEEADKQFADDQAKALQDIQDAFRPGSKVQTSLANIGGERSIRVDAIQKEMLNIQKLNLKANQEMAAAIAAFDGPVFPSN